MTTTGFSGIFSISNWTINTYVGQNKILTGNAPTSVTFISGSIPSINGESTMTIKITSPGSISFSFSSSTSDPGGLSRDPFGYLINSSRSNLTNVSSSSASGSRTVHVSKDDVFGFYVNTEDGYYGPSTTIVNNFIFNPDPEPPTITNFSIPTKIYGNVPFEITAPTSNSSGSFSYTSSNSNVATVSGTNITIVGAGSTMITATQAATSNNSSGSVTATFVVAKANPTIQAWSIASKIYSDAAFAITPPTSNSTGAFSYSSSNTSVATVSGSNINIVGAGSTMITATQASTSNYDTGSITATLIVKGYSTINVTLKDGNNNTITPSNNIYTVVFNKNKIPRMDKLTLTTSSNNNASALSSVVQSGNSFVQYSSNGNIRMINNGTIRIKVSQDETSNYLATEKTITLYITALAIQGRRPVFLRGL